MTASALVPVVLAAGGLLDVEWTLFGSTLVLFLIFAGVLARFAWKPLLAMIEEREKGIQEAVDGAQKASAEAQATLEKHKDLLREAGREREEILKKALEEADALKGDLHAKARAEGEQMIQRAREQVQREASAAMQELRSQVADLAIQAAGKIVASSLTAEAQKKLVDDFVASVPKAEAR
jgi:F-type H+-transporting ATPase subunit b